MAERIAVLMGGKAAERPISLRSGQAVLKALTQLGYAAEGVDTDAAGLQLLMSGAFQRCFIALHGRGGEDGQIQGFLETLGLPYTGSRVTASAMAMDKALTKQIWQSCGLPTPDWRLLLPGETLSAEQAGQWLQALGGIAMVKPVQEGSSIGMSRVTDVDSLLQAVTLASQYDARILVERWIAGAEYTVAIVGDQALPMIRLQTPNAFYDFEAKYQASTTQYLCPCGLPADTEQALQRLASQAFRALGAEGWGRVDLMLDGQGQPWLLELNTVPGMTEKSLVPMAARQAGWSFEQLVDTILQQAH